LCEDLPTPYKYRGILYCQDEETGRVVEEVLSRYGIPLEAIGGMAAVKEGKGINLTTPQALLIHPPGLVRRGISFIKELQRGGRLTSAAIRLIGTLATKEVVELNRDETERFLRGETLEEYRGGGVWVIVRYRGYPLGGGILSSRGLIPQLPKAVRSITHLPP